MTNDETVIGQNMKRLRKALINPDTGKPMSQLDLALKAGVSQSLVNRWEQGRMRTKDLFLVARLLDVSAAELVGGRPPLKAAEVPPVQPIEPDPLGNALVALDAAKLNDSDLDDNQRARVLIMLHSLARNLDNAGATKAAIMEALASDIPQILTLVRAQAAPQGER